MMTAPNGDKRARWIEIACAVIASIAASAAVNFLTIPVTLEQFRNKLTSLDQEMVATQQQLATEETRNMSQEVRIAVNSERITTNDQRWNQIDEQLKQLNDKLDRRMYR